METLNVTAARDQEQIYRILDNLISTNKEFRILITVPSGEKGRDQVEIAGAAEDMREVENVAVAVDEEGPSRRFSIPPSQRNTRQRRAGLNAQSAMP